MNNPRFALGTCALCSAVLWDGIQADGEVWAKHPYTSKCLLSGVTGPVRMFKADHIALGTVKVESTSQEPTHTKEC